MDRDQKIRACVILVNVINSLELNDIHHIVANDTKWISLRQEMVDNLLRTYPVLNVDKVKEFFDSIIGNVIKAYDDLRDSKPEGIDMVKLQLWREVWMKEKEKSRQKNDTDSIFQLSKKMRIHQATHAEATSSDHPLTRDDADRV